MIQGIFNTIAVMAAISGQPSETLYQQSGPASLYLSATKEDGKGRMALADTLFVTVQVDGPVSLQVRWPDVLNTKTWRLRKKVEVVTTQTMDGIQWRQTVELTSLLPGDNDLLLLPVHYREQKDAPWKKAAWTSIAIVVRTQIQDPKLEDARGITDIERLPIQTPSSSIYVWGAIAATATVVIIGLVWMVGRRRTQPAIRVTPEEWAQRELERLDRLQLPEQSRGSRYVTLVSNVIRAYFEKRFALAARRQTTMEFLNTVAESDAVGPDQGDLLRDFLTQCDRVKFAGVDPTPEDCNALRDSGRKIIEMNASECQAD